MRWIERNAWWLFFGMALTFMGFGITDVIAGAAADQAIATGLTGLTLAELEADSSSPDHSDAANGGRGGSSGPSPSGRSASRSCTC